MFRRSLFKFIPAVLVPLPLFKVEQKKSTNSLVQNMRNFLDFFDSQGEGARAFFQDDKGNKFPAKICSITQTKESQLVFVYKFSLKNCLNKPSFLKSYHLMDKNHNLIKSGEFHLMSTINLDEFTVNHQLNLDYSPYMSV